ncbi:hypothetical protein KL86DPRO_20608 [uncultured delta proteobacterium]|uniref:Uncharacterized protein n=1 Tax=uncultured delta proteobacterium TaxID=34034 RepID=A0A212K3B2_9DELT|nr:hypothetical protein KL86DPRO_20608 [uncultured delta proteobacterium]
MGKITVLGGDLPPGTEFYNNPGSIGGFAVAGLALADPEAVRKLGAVKRGFFPKIYFIATLDDGRRALAATNPATFRRLERDIADGPVPAETVADRKKENTRAGVIFIVVYIGSFLVLERSLPGYLPYMAAFAAAIAAGVAAKVFFPGSKR